MYNLTSLRAFAAGSALLFVAAGFSPTAHATSTVSSTADAFLFLVDVESTGSNTNDLLIEGTDFGSINDSVEGNASSSPDSSVFYISNPLGFFDMSVSAFTDAAADANGAVESSSLTFGFVDLTNASATDDYTINYVLNYTLDSSADIEFVDADAFSNASLSLSQDGVGLFSSATFADALLGPPSDADSGNFFFSVLLAPGESVSLTLRATTFGVAEAVPVPAALPLLGSGLIGLFGLARRRRAG